MSARGIREPRGQDMDLVSWEPGLWDLHRPFLHVLSSNSGLLEFHVGSAMAPRSAGLLQDRHLRHILPEGKNHFLPALTKQSQYGSTHL